MADEAAASTAQASAPSAPAVTSPAAGAVSDSRPAYQGPEAFFSDAPPTETATEPPDDAAAAETATATPSDPDSLLKAALAAVPEDQRGAVEQHVAHLRRQAGRASAEAQKSSSNYNAAAAWAGLFQRLAERARGAGLDISDLGAAPPPEGGDDSASAFDLNSVGDQAVGQLNDQWAEGILKAFDQADELASSAADLEAAAAGDAREMRRAEGLRSQARAIRARAIIAQTQSAVWSALGAVRQLQGHYDTRFNSLAGSIPNDDAANTHAMAGEALSAASQAIDERTGKRLWHDRGFFTSEGSRVKLSKRGRELIHPMLQWASERGLDLREPDVFEEAYAVANHRHPAAETAPASSPARRGDPTSALSGQGTISAASPQLPSTRTPEATAAERAVQSNRRRFAAA